MNEKSSIPNTTMNINNSVVITSIINKGILNVYGYQTTNELTEEEKEKIEKKCNKLKIINIL